MNLNRKSVAVTGASGSLGQALVKRLCKNGYTVRALVRRAADETAVSSLGATPIRGDLRQPDTLDALVRDCDVVFHLAAWIMGKGRQELAYQELAHQELAHQELAHQELAHAVNVVGTNNLIQSAAKMGCRRVVYASSMAVYGPVLSGNIDENTPTWSVGDPYGDSKIESETQAKQAAQRGDIELTILRPTLIYGPASVPWTLEPLKLMRRGLPIIIGDGEDLADAIYVDDVARAFELAGFVTAAAGETFNIGAGSSTWNEFMGELAAISGTKVRRSPAWLAKLGAKLAANASKLFTGKQAIVPELVDVMISRATYSHEKAKRVLGFEAEVSLEEGMHMTQKWLRQTGQHKHLAVALVTGGAHGLGRETALALKAKGLTVWAIDLDKRGLDELEAQGIKTAVANVTSEADVQKTVQAIVEAEGGIDLLFNIAGVLKPAPLEIQPMDDIQQQFDVNTLGPLRLVQAVAPIMRRQGNGRIINISSTNGFMVTPFLGSYSASKYALEALSDSLRMELSPWGVKVILIQPGGMKTAMPDQGKAYLQAQINEGSNDWEAYMTTFFNSSMWGTDTATEPKQVAQRIVKISLSKRPKPRYVGTFDAFALRILNIFPASLKDFFFIRLSGLDK